MIDFLCIGAQKSGTTLLYEHLKKVDEIFLPQEKELHFFDNDQYYQRGLGSYLDNFKSAQVYQLKGEITPSYLFFDKVPMRIKQCIRKRDIKFIVLLRNPVDRAYSQYNMAYLTQEHEKFNFEQALIYESFRLKDHLDFINYTYIQRGFYSKQILNYFKYFKKEQFKFVLYENFVKDQSRYIKEIFNFLNIDRKIEIQTKEVFRNQYKPMKSETRYILEKVYEDEINILENLLGIDLSIWKGNMQL